jgi:hypothetical protein
MYIKFLSKTFSSTASTVLTDPLAAFQRHSTTTIAATNIHIIPCPTHPVAQEVPVGRKVNSAVCLE